MTELKIEGNVSPVYDNNLCMKKLEDLLEKYENNSYVKNKLMNHIIVQLPLILDTANTNFIKREERKQQLTMDQNDFTNKFMNTHNYYYIPNTEIFINYDKTHFSIYKEDDILHQILTRITQEKCLIPWKHKIKLNIIKKIKERNLFNCIPESNTIQDILNQLYPLIFTDKDNAKYFLTILGDIILRKHDNLIYLVNIEAKKFIKILSNHCYNYFGNVNLINNFKYKYHEQHTYATSRLLNINYIKELPNELNKHILDLLCIAVHYSTRYNNADEFVKSTNNLELINYTFYLPDNTQEAIINNFIDKSLNRCNNSNISFKNMLYLWKLWLKEQQLPQMMYINTLKNIIKEKVEYDEANDNFLNLSSTYLPLVSNFINFWEATIIEADEEMEIEIDELVILFKLWYKLPINIKDNILLDLIKHYYNEVIIEEDKYILNIKCSLWNKKEDINKSLQELKEICQKKPEKYSLAIDYAYDYYSKNSKKSICVASKKYFDKYVTEYLGEYLDDDKLILPFWWLS